MKKNTFYDLLKCTMTPVKCSLRRLNEEILRTEIILKLEKYVRIQLIVRLTVATILAALKLNKDD